MLQTDQHLSAIQKVATQRDGEVTEVGRGHAATYQTVPFGFPISQTRGPQNDRWPLQEVDGPDNTPAGLRALVLANEHYRARPWPNPFDRTIHRLHVGDSRNLSWIADSSVHLVVTSPPYWTLKEYGRTAGQMGFIEDYEEFLDELDTVWRECARILTPGGRICCVVGDVCVSRKKGGRHRIMPLHADIQVRMRRVGLDCLTPILWYKIANGATEAEGNGAGFYGKPYQPGQVIKNDIEHILFFRKGGQYRSVMPLQKALSMLTKDEMQTWFRSFWTDIKGASTRDGHPAPYPVELVERLIRMFSFAGDTIADPFSGLGSTALAAIKAGRNSVSAEIDPTYAAMARRRVARAIALPRTVGAVDAEIHYRLNDRAVSPPSRLLTKGCDYSVS